MIRVNCPTCDRPVDVPPALAGTVMDCPHPDCGRPMAIPPAAQVAQPLPPMERCYDCGRPIPEGRVCRREVAVSSSYSSGSISASTYGGGKLLGDSSSTYGTYGGSSSTYATVSLCPTCDAEREEARLRAEARARRAVRDAEIFFAIFLGVLGVLAVVGAVVLLRYWRAEAERRAAPASLAGVPPPGKAADPPKKRDEPPPPELLPPPVTIPELLPKPRVESLPPTPEQLAKDRERRASLLLRAAREHLAAGSRARAQDILEELVRTLPDTEAAGEARELLKKLDGD